MQRCEYLNKAAFIQHLQSNLEIAKLNNPLIIHNRIANSVFFEEPCVGAKNLIPKIYETIKSAEQEVLIIGYKIDKDSDGETDLIAALNYLSIKAKQENITIRVRIIINRREGAAAYFKPNSRNESNIRNLTFDKLDYQYVEHNHISFGSYHAKQFIVDGRVAILCSGDLTKRNNYKNGYEGMIEVGTVIHGTEIVDCIRQDYINAWNSSNCNLINKNDKKKSIPKAVFAIDDESSDVLLEENEFDLKDQGYIEESDNEAIYSIINNEPVSVLYIAKASSGDFRRQYVSPYKIAVISAIRYAESIIDIMTPNLNDPDVINELVNAIIKGVQVNIVIGKHMNDSSESNPFMGGTNYENINILLNKLYKLGGKSLHNVNIRFVADEGKAIPENHPNSLHAKFICIDNEVVIAGSSILDLQSIYHSREADICFQSQAVAKEYKNKLFDPVFFNGIDYFDDKASMIMQENINKAMHFTVTGENYFKEKNYHLAILNYITAIHVCPSETKSYLHLQSIFLKQDPFVLATIPKYVLIDAIKCLSLEEQIKLVNECIDPTMPTELAKRFWKQELFTECDLDSGNLQILVDYSKKLTRRRDLLEKEFKIDESYNHVFLFGQKSKDKQFNKGHSKTFDNSDSSSLNLTIDKF